MSRKTTDFLHCADVRALRFNTKMYVLADYLDVPALQKMALANCTILLKRADDFSLLADPIMHALRCTKPNDTGLRPHIIRSCALMRKTVNGDAELIRMLQDLEPLAWLLQSEATEVEQSLRADLCAAAREQDKLRESVAKEKERVIESDDKFCRLTKVINYYEQCRNCRSEFGAMAHGYEGGMVRCAKCQCRHWSSDVPNGSGY
jgi:hypothetical protein